MTKECFVISPIGKNGSEIRHRSDGFLDEVIRPVAEEAGYRVSRADEDKAPGMVTESIINKIIDADLVIVDLHGHNPNVMYEVAVRHASGRPLVQMIEHDESLPFDIGGINTVMYDPSVRGLRQWREDLRAAIASSANSGTSNPVVRAGLMRTLGKQDNPEGAALKLVLGEVESLRAEVRSGQSVEHVIPRRLRAASAYDRSEREEFIVQQVQMFLESLTVADDYSFEVSSRPLSIRVVSRKTGATSGMLLPPVDVKNGRPFLAPLFARINEFMDMVEQSADES